MEARASDVCVAFAATEDFLPGVLVAVSSFLRCHPGFRGDMALFHDGWPEALRAGLERAFPPLRLERVGAELQRRLERLAGDPDVPRRDPADFYRFEAFRLDGYRKILYCDSDLLFRAPVDELFASGGTLLCCGDESAILGRRRDAATFASIESAASAGPAGALENTFNSGLLLIDRSLTGESAHAELLALLEAGVWRGTNTEHTDQFVLNRHFAGRQTLVSSAYNYPLSLAKAIVEREGIAPAAAKAVHFTGPEKPWNPEAMLRWLRGGVPFAPHPAYSWWYAAWMDCLTRAHLRDIARQDA